MARVLARTRTVRTLSLSRALSLGAGKYASCGALAGGVAVAAGAALGPIAATLAFVIIFYVVEVQLVFLFPIALDASAPPHHWWRAARASTVRAGGTWRAFWTVLPIAAHMLLGLASMSPRRAWCAGCAAVTIWYEESSGGRVDEVTT